MLLPLLLVLMGVHVASSDAVGNDRFGRLNTGVSGCRLTQAERSMESANSQILLVMQAPSGCGSAVECPIQGLAIT